MPLHRKSFRYAILIAAAGLFAQAAPLGAQTLSHPRWTLTGAGTTLRVGGREGWGYGPELALRFDANERWGAGLTLSLPALGNYAGAAAADLGATYTLVARSSELGFTAGLTAFLAGDSSELTGAGIGGFGGAHVTAWLTPGFGVTTSARIRVAGGSAYPSLSAGLAVRF